MAHTILNDFSEHEVGQISKLHKSALYWTLNSQIGIKHLSRIYKFTSEHDESLVLASFQNDKCIASLSLTWNYPDLKKDLQKKCWSTFLRYFLMKPGSFAREVIAFKGMNSRTPKVNNSAYLLTCFIDKDFRNRGLARSLIRQALNEVPKGTEWLIVDVDVEAVGAIDFYQRCGFKMWSEGTESSILMLEMEK